jgi:hypothetical protein
VGLALALVLIGCSGGGGGGSNPVTCTSLSFDRALSTPASGDVYLEQAAGTCSTIDISVIVNDLAGIWTVGFDLTYPAAIVQYQSYVVGPLLLKGGVASPLVVIVQPTATGVRVSMSRVGSDPTVTAVGSESLITLRFSRVGAGTGLIDFDSSPTSISDVILDNSNPPVRSGVFGPGHGGMVIVP